MGILARTNFGRGWMPDADAIAAPADALLRMDNCVLDELGVVALRKGSTPINTSPFTDHDIHSLFTDLINGTRYRFAGAGDYIYRNGTKQTALLAGSGDVLFGATQGHVFWTRSSSHGSFDGSTVRRWGIPMSAIGPSAQPADEGERIELADGATGESPAFTIEEGTHTHQTGHDGTASGALELTANSTTGRARAEKRYSTILDTTTWSGTKDENPQDYVEMWLYVTDPLAISRVTLALDCNPDPEANVFTDSFRVDWRWNDGVPAAPDTTRTTDYLDNRYDLEGAARDRVRQGRREDGSRRGSALFPDPAITAANWTRLRAKREQFSRTGTTKGTGWDSIIGLRVEVVMKAGGTVSVCRIDDIAFVHGQLLGDYSWRYILARQADAYTALSPVSDPSAEVSFSGESARIFIPPDSARDPDATEVWIYRMGQDLNSFMRVATKSLSELTDTAFSMTAKWEIGTLSQEETFAHGACNTTMEDEDDYENDFLLYRRSNHTLDDEIVWLNDVGASLNLAITTGGFIVEDNLSDRDALELGIYLEADNTTPPNDIVGIAGPYYDRLFCLTETTLWPSRVLNPESYAVGQGITVGNAEETAYWVMEALGGLYVGTSRDIYRIDGTLGELPDGTIEVQKTPLNIDHPPVGQAVCKDGPVLVYLAHDGWRAMTGQSSTLLVGPTSLLYRGYTRHGISPVNLDTGRVKVTIAKGQLVAIIPEGSSTTSSTVLYRYVFGLQRWYRHTYPSAWRSVAREPDGTLIAGDTAGQVWTLDDDSTGDDGADIPVVIWTRSEDDNQPFSPKTSADVQLNLDTNGDTLTVNLHQDNATGSSLRRTTTATGRETKDIDTTNLGQWRQLQLRLTGDFGTFYFGGYAIPYHLVPLGVTAWDSGPLDLGADIKWLRQVNVKARAGSALTVTVYFDGVKWPAVVAESTTEVWNTTAIHEAILGRNERGAYHGRVPRIVITSSSPFFPYWVELIKRNTSAQTDKTPVRFSAQVGGGVLA